jgi:hypothetical protein
MAARIDEDKLVVGLERINISGHVPALHTLRKPVLQDKRGSFACDLVMDTDALMGHLWHRHTLLDR